ncbi:2-phosphosulfolactate phosphatase [Rhodococcus sp. CH91]|uniref:2-phosphosulfolactate phosphatase n=1 Tax=Rhodococcus sp. CH91 TaxID=2910256 RepID=UPI001F4B3F6B|nr:2-phosphosulfolactate phosphatase [Rhodococcus sp. CH91]
MNPAHQQLRTPVRFEWGPVGASALRGSSISVVVDVLSFTTTLSVAADLGIEVLPYRWRDDSASEYADAHDALLAVGRSEAEQGAVSLSPNTIRNAVGVRRLVLPSPNGSSIAYSLAASSTVCIGACVRNAAAVGTWIAEHYEDGTDVSVIAAGERWLDRSLRPCVEDLWGAGAVLAELMRLRSELTASVEAEAAVAAWNTVRNRFGAALEDCASGQELIAAGYRSDVLVAAEVGESTAVPVLVDNRFIDRSSVPKA